MKLKIVIRKSLEVLSVVMVIRGSSEIGAKYISMDLEEVRRTFNVIKTTLFLAEVGRLLS